MLVPDAAETQLSTIARYDPLWRTSVHKILQYMLRLGDFAREFHNRGLEQLFSMPHSVAARLHRWLTEAEGDSSLSPRRPSRDFVASLRMANGTLECPANGDRHSY